MSEKQNEEKTMTAKEAILFLKQLDEKYPPVNFNNFVFYISKAIKNGFSVIPYEIKNIEYGAVFTGNFEDENGKLQEVTSNPILKIV